ncbi:hypothetical protein [Enterobacter hormaechei]|uniref:hypothetical protein n=1 Tax=Enterobacter hormaechei TaxID=158836 RepID=UPI001F4B4A00|nr:hypothetical protein [Enterobacter hormaechei]
MPKGHNTPSLYEMLSGNFSGGLSLSQVSEQNQVILSVLDNMQRILNCRAGTLAHGLVRYGTEFMPEGRVLIRHLKQQQYLDARAAI